MSRRKLVVILAVLGIVVLLGAAIAPRYVVCKRANYNVLCSQVTNLRKVQQDRDLLQSYLDALDILIMEYHNAYTHPENYKPHLPIDAKEVSQLTGTQIYDAHGAIPKEGRIYYYRIRDPKLERDGYGFYVERPGKIMTVFRWDRKYGFSLGTLQY